MSCGGMPWRSRCADLQTTNARAREAPLPELGQPEPPDGLAELEVHVMAADPPTMVLIDRTLVRALLRYVRRLEAAAKGSFK